MSKPSAVLTPPNATSSLPDTVSNLMHLSDWFSPGSLGLAALKEFGGPDIKGEWEQLMVGDWEEVGKAADALRKLGTFCDEFAADVEADLGRVRRDWSGEGAQAASAYFGNLAKVLRAQKPNFVAIADQYDETAFGVQSAAEAVGGLLEELIDICIVIASSTALMALSWYTGIGGFIAGSALATALVKGGKVLLEIAEWKGKIMLCVDALFGLFAGNLAAIEGFRTTQLPGQYNHRAV